MIDEPDLQLTTSGGQAEPQAQPADDEQRTPASRVHRTSPLSAQLERAGGQPKCSLDRPEPLPAPPPGVREAEWRQNALPPVPAIVMVRVGGLVRKWGEKFKASFWQVTNVP